MKRRLIISDIHGCNQTFNALLDQISFSSADTLYLLGDYIDRGNDSSGVLDQIIELQTTGYNIVPLRGNHEENLLSAYEEYDCETFKFFVSRNNSSDLISSDGQIKQKYLSFISDLPYFIELPDYILVHAGINFNIPEPLDDKVALLELRQTRYDGTKAQNRRIVFGHQPYNIEEIEEAIETRARMIPLDNGCFYTKPHKIYDYTRLGNLICLNLDNFSYTVQKNIDV